MIKKIFRYVITLVVMTIAVGLLYALYNHNIWGIQQYVADYAVILFGVFIGIIYFIFAILPQMMTERKLDNYDMSKVYSTKMFLDKYENDLSDQEVQKNVVAGKYDR